MRMRAEIRASLGARVNAGEAVVGRPSAAYHRFSMEAHLQEWLNLVVRLIHVVAAIMWIGDSFLFMFLDKSLEAPRAPREGDVIGEMWMTHGGGFYELVKRRSLTLEEMPPTLHWFKWESYTTWMSGFTLLVVVYYMTGGSYLVDPTVSRILPWQAILLSIGLLVVGWLLYDTLCNLLVKHTEVLAALCFGLVVAAGWGLMQVLSARAAFVHVGALMATCMSANVFFRIIPGQKKMLADTLAKRPVDTSFGVRAKTRSTHNHYITLPVVLLMLSNHFPSLYGAAHAWLVLALLFVFGMGVKWVMNFKARSHPVVLAGTVLSLAGIVFLTLPKPSAAMAALAGGEPVPYALVHEIVQERCVSCHAAKPANASFPAPPAGVALETPELVRQYAQRILVRVYDTKTMPLGNMTGMTEGERALVGRWVAQGATLGALDEAVPAELRAERSRTGAADAAPADPAAAAKKLFAERCSSCHGAAGDGAGPAAQGLEPKPRNFKDAAWQKDTPDERIEKVIVEGGRAVGKAPIMPPSPDLAGKPEVVKELVKLVRGVGKGAP